MLPQMFNAVRLPPNRKGWTGPFNSQGSNEGTRARRRFSPEEDAKILQAVETMGDGPWEDVARCVPGRTSRQVRERYRHYLCPELNLTAWTPEEEALLRAKFEEYGPQWSILKSFFPNRSAVNVKNHWTTMVSRESRNDWEARNSVSSAQPIAVSESLVTTKDDRSIETQPPDQEQQIDIFDVNLPQQSNAAVSDVLRDPFFSFA
jgi:hypothetical protein